MVSGINPFFFSWGVKLTVGVQGEGKTPEGREQYYFKPEMEGLKVVP